MTASHHVHTIKISRTLAAISAAMALVAFISWLIGSWHWLSLGTGRVPMAPSTALLLTIVNAAVFVRCRQPDRCWLAEAGLGVAAVTGGLVLLRSFLGWSSPLEQWLSRTTEVVGSMPSGQMSPLTGLTFVLLSGGALLDERRWYWTGSGLTLVTFWISAVVFLGYLAGTPVFADQIIPMALWTAIAFALTSASVVLSGVVEGALPERLLREAETGGGSQPRVRLWILAFSVGAVLAAAGGFVYERWEAGRLERERAEGLATVARTKVDQIVRWRFERTLDARRLAESPTFEAAVWRWLRNRNDAIAQAELQQRLTLEPGLGVYSEALLVDTEARILLASRSRLPPAVDATTERAVRTAVGSQEPVWGDLHHSVSGEPSLDVVEAVRDATNQPLAVVVLSVNAAEFLYPLVQAWPTPSGSAETILARRDDEHALFLNEGRFATNLALRRRESLSRTGLPVVQAVLGEVGVVHGEDYRGVRVMADLRAVPGTTWVMVSKVDAHEVSAAARRSALMILTSVVTLVLCAAGGTAYAFRSRQATERARMFELLWVSEEKYRDLVETAQELVWRCDGEGRLVYLNPAWELTHGYRVAEMLGKRFDELSRPDVSGRDAGAFARLLRDGSLRRYETTHLAKDGRQLTLLVDARATSDRAGRIVGAQGTAVDITERKRAEQELVRLNRVYRVLTRTSQVIVRAATPQQLFDAACRIAVHEGSYRMAWVGVVDEQTRLVHAVASNGHVAGYLDDLRVSVEDVPEGRGPAGMAMREARHFVCRDIDTDPVMAPWRDGALARGYRSAAAFPLRVGGVVRGVYTVYSAEPGRFGDEEVALLGALASDLSLALDLLERERQRALAETALRAASMYARSLIEASLDPLVTISRDGQITDVNKAAEDATGVARQALIGTDFANYFTEPERARDGYRRVLARGFVRDYPLTIRHTSGRAIDVLWDGSIYLNEAGEAQGVFAAARDITERKQAEEALRWTERRYRTLFDQAADGIFVCDTDGHIVDVNESFAAMHGYTVEEIRQKSLDDLDTPETTKARRERMERIVLGESLHFVVEHYHKDGHVFPLDVAAGRIELDGKTYVLTFHRDLSERKALEGQLAQAQKMESVGRLAGGLAHDFNNMLTSILGNAELALKVAGPDSPLSEDLQEIMKAGRRSADLVRQLLAFSRQQPASPRTLNLNDALADMSKMLKRLIGENIELVWMPGGGLWPVRLDPAQANQVLSNLVVNARDAISGVGKVTIRTTNRAIDAAYCARRPGLAPGDYVELTVSDTGCGMPPEVLTHIYEPFFSTKETGKGTGLGLSTVYGIVKQNGGFIDVQSDVGHGTTFTIFLPRLTADVASAAVPAPSADASAGGNETVLLVEDEAVLLKLAARILSKRGYTVLAAATPAEAIGIARTHAGTIHLLVTDIVMPQMNGRDLAHQLVAMRPDLKCLYMSGYAADMITTQGMLDGEIDFVPKPFTSADLTAKVREILDRGAVAPSPPRPAPGAASRT